MKEITSFTQPLCKKIKSHPSTLTLYGQKLSNEGLTSDNELQKIKLILKWLENEFEKSASYKSDLKWFDGVWSRFKPGLGKDKDRASGVEKILKAVEKISQFLLAFLFTNLKKIFDLRNQSIERESMIGYGRKSCIWNTNSLYFQ